VVRRPRPEWDWRGVVGVILATGIAGAVIILCLGAVLQSQTISAQGADIISTALGASVGAVATYLGGWSRDRGNGEPDKPEQPDSSGQQ
jgi:hypothetical protein